MADYYIDPLYVDLNLVSSLDFQKHLTDYVSLIESVDGGKTFPEEIVTSNIYWHTDSHSDPITSKISFFSDLDKGKLKVKETPHGAVKSKTTGKALKNKNIRDQLKSDQHLSTASGNKYDDPIMIDDSTVEVLYKTNIKKWVSTRKGPIAITSTGKWDKTLKILKGDEPITPPLDIQNDDVTLQYTMLDEYGMRDMSPWFIMFWLEKFYTAHHVIKQDLIELLGEDNEYLVSFSDNVGQLKNLIAVDDASTLPIWDEGVSTIPTTINTIARYTLKEEFLDLSDELSKRTTQIYRSNMFNVQDDASRDSVKHFFAEFPTRSHGVNLIPDSEHRIRMYKFIETIRAAIKEHLKGLYDVLEFLSDRDNYMVISKPKEIMLKVEDFTMSVDLLKNKIKSYSKEITDTTITRYGKRTLYNFDIKNASVLAVPGVTESIADFFTTPAQ